MYYHGGCNREEVIANDCERRRRYGRNRERRGQGEVVTLGPGHSEVGPVCCIRGSSGVSALSTMNPNRSRPVPGLPAEHSFYSLGASSRFGFRATGGGPSGRRPCGPQHRNYVLCSVCSVCSGPTSVAEIGEELTGQNTQVDRVEHSGPSPLCHASRMRHPEPSRSMMTRPARSILSSLTSTRARS